MRAGAAGVPIDYADCGDLFRRQSNLFDSLTPIALPE
jgi:hypothetical protein